MRPALLNPLFAPVATLPGVGPKMALLFDVLLGEPGRGARVLDLLFHLPHGVIDRSAKPRIAEAPLDTIVTLEVTVEEHRPGPPNRRAGPYRVIVADPTGSVALVFFHASQRRMEQLLPLGEKRWISGKLEQWDGRLQMVHPDRIVDAAGLAAMPAFEPVYGLTAGLGPRVVAKAASAALENLPDLPEWQDEAWMRARRLPTFAHALGDLHRPISAAALAPDVKARQRLAYDELLASQLALLLARQHMKKAAGRSQVGDGRIAGRIMAALPFSLTGAQTAALEDIRRDLATSERMLRLLQGDVGSGKTVVALLAMASVVESGRQAALMAPTEILSRQHYEKLKPLAEAAGLRTALLTGRDKGTSRRTTLEALAAGEIDILFGTHALFQEEVAFADLGMAVVDEQHRFGVHQRLALSRKGEAVDVLVMTATPIPRTLVLSYFGDMDVSVLREKPAGRQPIDTRIVPLDRLDEVVAGVGRAIAAGAQAYWVCPLVEENEELDLAAAQERFETLTRIFGPRVGLVHGQMKGKEKDAAMAAFAAGETSVLVATTVIEVGVDVPQATIMVIEHAEQFGLAQLHQLRGRVGRGSGKSSCLLLYRGPLGEVAKARLETMRRTEDGFEIAEEDLKLRGEGDVLGTRQSGMPGFRLAIPELHGELLQAARDDAKLALATDPDLAGERGQALRVLLYLFERDAAIRLLRAG
ncbi:ATP-dependent DNA helicase RecG [Alsobacter metallidurans]|uniref:ATP-dependent DNA helicase RecG n=1 Tax=Alsobacter metallidurans TaxID=340221 RepID=A0A917I6X8_9HYPH|nr:ATP-dependent DNA helicase RecG [Alsobacter metallidurans]GGH16918.1 ATP-dependent DNA helicase RecG [Alsobacter metallidurans]